MASETGSTGTGAATLLEARALEASPSRASLPGPDAPARPGRSGEHKLPWLLQRAEPADERPVLAVIGNGMVGQRFCQRCVELGLHRSHRMVVFGEEALPAYDRVRLTDVLAGQDPSALVLQPALWYADHDIDLRLSERVVGFDLARRTLTTQLGDELGYERLVLATGSRVLVPPIPGTEHPGVFVYRSAEDVLRIRARALAVGRRGGRAVVIGSGLLGIEAGQALKDLGCEVAFVESARHLLARQLDPTAAGIVADLLLQAGFELYVGQKVERIELLSEQRPRLVSAGENAQDTRLRVEFSESSPCKAIECGLVVLASGVQPRDELARQAGILCPAPGGIQVDADLCTSDAHVFAIGECARFEGVCHGLVAPGNAMAEVLAERLAGKPSRFTRVRPSTRLEVGDRQIVVLGDSKDSGPGVEELRSKAETGAGSYRRLVLREGNVVGATAIGEWSDLPFLENAIVARAPLGRSERRRFARGLPLWPTDARPPVEQWPDSATVCACIGVSCGALRRAREDGHRTLEQLCDRTRAGSSCGSCQPLIAAFAGVPSVPPPAPGRQLGLGLLSLLVLGGLIAAALHGPVALQTSVQNAFAFDVLWRSSLARQISGFSLAALCLITGTSLALRRRWRRLRGADFDASRTLHVLLGVFTLVGTGVHTGMRQGRGLDFALLCSLLSMMLVGATTSLLLAGGRGPSQGLRRWGTRLHVWIAWPLPVLLVAHVVKTYFF